MMRRFLSCTVALAVLLSLGCDAGRPPRVEKEWPVVRLTEHVYVVQASDETPTPANQGLSSNPGFVVTGKGVVVIDPGATEAIGNWLVEKIRAVTSEPVIAIINTHSDGDHWLANHALKAAYPNAVIYAHPTTRERIDTSAGHKWLKRINDATHGAGRGTEITLPEFEFEHEEVLQLRRVHFRLYHADAGQAGTIVEVVGEGVLFVSDNHLTEELRARLGRVSVKHIVPAHGVLESPDLSRFST